jgi:hypothetical protein
MVEVDRIPVKSLNIIDILFWILYPKYKLETKEGTIQNAAKV